MAIRKLSDLSIVVVAAANHYLDFLPYLGILFSGVGVVESTCTMAASVIYNALYPATRQVHHGFCFFLMAGTLAIPFVLIL